MPTSNLQEKSHASHFEENYAEKTALSGVVVFSRKRTTRSLSNLTEPYSIYVYSRGGRSSCFL